MPGSGKTEVGRALSGLLHRELLDTDAEVTRTAGMPIPALFRQAGEAAFRRLERDACDACGRQTGKVIATGGGAPLFPENVAALRQNGRVYCLERPLAQLATEGRPLSKGGAALETLWSERRAYYQAASDKSIQNDASIMDAANMIQEDFYETTSN